MRRAWETVRVVTTPTERLERWYAPRIAAHDGDAPGVGWSSRALQRLRFDVLLDALPRDALRDASILDVGCGTGDLVDLLTERGHAGRYVGVDALPAMIERARARHPQRAFEVATIEDLANGPVFDLVVASGVFVVATAGEVRAAIPQLFARARGVVSFNCLSAWAAMQRDDELYLDPLEVLAWSRESSSRVALRCDYLPNDFTIYVRRA